MTLQEPVDKCQNYLTCLPFKLTQHLDILKISGDPKNTIGLFRFDSFLFE